MQELNSLNFTRQLICDMTLVTKVMEFNIHEAQHWFAKHPYSKNEADFTAFDLTHSFVSDGRIKKEVKKTIGDILQVDSSWLDN